MFRIESYITSIILTYVDRYIKNFRQQDAQVSLWEGDGSFQNLNLDLDVLEQELNLPFSFVSGHIHELLIHVPWTRLTSEPVQITINTIECVMKLKPVGSQQQQAKPPRKNPRAVEDPQSQSSLVSSLVNKIVCNLSVTCNNLILKYVEEDIVLSMNIKTLSFGTVNNNWEPAFMELSPTQLELRKLISLSDVTVCLDKRNASGRIESYLEPLLYRCFMTVRLWQSYASVSAKRASSTRLDILCECMAFTVSEPQLPMLMRLAALCLALHRKQLSQTVIPQPTDDPTVEKSEDDAIVGQPGNQAESWSSWALSWMPSLVPLAEFDDDTDNILFSDSSTPANNTVNIGFYIDTLVLDLKLCESDGSGGVKTQTQGFLQVSLKGCRMDLFSHNHDWTNIQMGISEATVKPEGDCCCGVSELTQLVYLSSGSVQEDFLSGSLFDKKPSPLQDRDVSSWKSHLEAVSETIMLEKTPAIAVDYLSCIQDKTEEEESDEEDDDERVPAKEKVLIRYVAGPVVIRLCSGLIHRIQMLIKTCSSYDYIPYCANTTVLPVVQDNQVSDLVHRLSERSIEMNEDLYSRYLPIHTSQFTAFHTIVELYPANHLPVHMSTLGRKISRSQRKVLNISSNPSSPPPCVTLEWTCAYATLTRPLYPEKILLMASKFQKDKLPKEIMDTSLTRLAFKAVSVSSSVRLPFLQAMKVVEVSSVSSEQTWHSLITPVEENIHSDVGVHVENVTITSSKAKLVLLCETISSLIATNNRQRYLAAHFTIYNTSLLYDAATTTDTIYLKLNVELLKVRRVLTGLSETTCLSVSACQVFATRLLEKGEEWETMIMSAPDTNIPSSVPLLEVLYQQPSSLNVFPPVLTFKLREVRFSADPLLYSWLLYAPTPTASFIAHSLTLKPHKSTESMKSRKVSDSSLSSYKRRAATPHESQPSSSERDTSNHPSSQHLGEGGQTVPFVPLSERVASWYPVWRTTVVCGDISQLAVYLPQRSLAAPSPLSMEEGLKAALTQHSPPIQVAVIKLPTVSLWCGSYKQGIEQYITQLPVRLPPALWTKDKDNFPWMLKVTDLHSYTLHGPTQLPLLKPVSFNCTIGTSPKFTERQVLTSLALCVHLDTTPVNIKISGEQVVLIVSLLMAQLKVLSVLLPVGTADSAPPTNTPSLLLSSDESSVSQSDEVSRSGGPVKVKLTGWLQWTLARTTLSIYNKPSIDSPDELKLTLDVEDIILSLDVERVYHKVKFKVATACVCHYTRTSPKESWKRGAFQGLVMRGYDPDRVTMKHSADESQAPAGFLMVTITRAKCNNFHSRLGSPSKHSSLTKKSLKSDKFITEIEVKMQPLDFVLSPTTLGMFVQVLDPLLSLTFAPVSGGEQKQPTTYHSSVLPLLYLDLMTIRVVLPTSQTNLAPNQPDVLIVQFDGMTANPHPENPLCRNPLRPDIYHKGEKQRILNIPGSELEDRQYQFNLTNVKVQTGMWLELKEIFVREVAVSSQQNPALDWNEGRSPMFQVPAHQLMHPLIHSFNLSVVLAPAMFYLDKDIVCGHAAEINAVSDIVVAVTMEQLFLCSTLSSEMCSVLHWARSARSLSTPKVAGATLSPDSLIQRSLPHLLEHDSGIESTESISSHAKPVNPNLPAVHAVPSSGFSQISGIVHSSLPSSVYPTPLVWPSKRSVIPFEVLVTGSAVIFSMFGVELSGPLTYEPLFRASISQPHMFLCRNTDNVITCQVSIFDWGVSCGLKGYRTAKQVTSKPFLRPLLETRNGDPDPLTGIPPAVFTTNTSWTNEKPPKIHVDIGRPIKAICSLGTIEYLMSLRTLLTESFTTPFKSCSTPKKLAVQVEEPSVAGVSEHYLRKSSKRFSKLSLSTQQMVLAVSSSVQNGAELLVSIGGCSAQVSSTLSLQQAVTGVLSLENMTVSTSKVLSPRTRLLLDPWQLTVHASLSWDSWLSTSHPPLVVISAYSDVLSVHLSPEQLHCLSGISQDYSVYLKASPESTEKPVLSRENSIGDSSNEEQQYHDDLQAGAFQFVDATGSRDDLPLTYQVMFWSAQSNTPTMAWKYPQPRIITKFCLLPIPFRETGDDQVLEPTCVLQYFSESQASYQDFVAFRLSETENQLLELPQCPPRAVATTWRVVLSPDAALTTPVRALAASIRVDTYFSPSLVPAVQLAVSLTAVQLSLWTYSDSFLPLPEPLDRYYLDRRFPEEHDFFSVIVEQANVAFSLWPKESQQVTLRGRARVDVLNYSSLSYECCVLPFPLSLSGHRTTDCQQWSLVTGLVHVRLGPAISHSLASSLQMWFGQQPTSQTVLTPYVVCNNSCLPIKFRQAGSDEYIPLQCYQCHLYSWRTTKHPMELEFGLLDPENNQWSKGLSLQAGTSTVIQLTSADQELALIVSIKRLSSTVCQVVLNGQLALHNRLSVPLEFRIVPECGDHSQSSLVVNSGSSPPTVVLDHRYGVSLKVRFSSLTTLWSGEIPLKHIGKQIMQWEVKLPMKEKGQFRSVWCHVVWDVVDSINQILVVISPLYTIKSLLPCPANVVVETPALSCSQAVPISGRGAVQHMDTPGLSDETHNLTFQLDGKMPVSSPPVSLNYHVMDGSPAPDPIVCNVNSLIDCLQRQPPSTEWPYLGSDWAFVDWIVTTQPDTVTQVKIRFSDDCVASNTLQVEVQPWALMVNTLGTNIYLQGRERTLCSLANCAVISPPLLESTFQIGVEFGKSVELSDPIQLKRGPGFEMPHIPGLLPPCGFINTRVTCGNLVSFMNVTSSETNSLRLIHVRSSYVVASLSKRDLLVAAIAVAPSAFQHSLPDDISKHAVLIKPQQKPSKLRSQPLTEWLVVGAGEGELVAHLVVVVGGMPSCPVAIPRGTERLSLTVVFPAAPETSAQQTLVMTCQQIDGQSHILLWDQPCPEVIVHNNTHSTVMFAKANTDNTSGDFVVDCELIKWQLRIGPGEVAHYNFPAANIGNDISPQQHLLPAATIAVVSPNSGEVKWSDAISLTQCTGRLLTLLGLPDLSLSVSKRGFTTHITLSQASHTEILAVDIRGQLSQQLLNERRRSSLSRSSKEDDKELMEDNDPPAPPSFPPSESGAGEGRGLDISVYVHGLTATLLSQSEEGCYASEVAALTLDCVAVTVHPHPHQDLCVREMKVHTTVGDIQIDNQEFSAGGYDFPVVMVMQKPQSKAANFVMSPDARKLVEKARSKGCAGDFTVVIDTNSHGSPAIQDVMVKMQPMQIYIEDKYILHLKECMLNTLPASLVGESPSKPVTKPASASHTREENYKTSSKDTHKLVIDELNNDSARDTQKKETSEVAEEEDLFNVSEPDLDNQLPEVPAADVESSPERPETPEYQSASMWTANATSSPHKEIQDQNVDSVGFPVPAEVLSASRDLARPLRLRSLSISELDLLVSIHTSTRFYIALDHSPLQLAAFRRSSLFTTAYRLGQSLTLHYFFGAIYGTGWALGSLELLGAPGGLARSLGLGLRDFISLPLQGMLRGPTAFFIGIAHGSASLMQHFAAGTITSVTRLASSWARTLDRLTLDCRDLERSEQLRRLRPQSLTQGVVQGLSEFGISLIGAISSIAHHPLQYMMSEAPDRSLVNSIGLGLVGVVTRPLSGMAELVALTGEGLLSGVGWTNTPVVRHEPMTQQHQSGSDARLKYQWKLLMPAEQLLLISEAMTDCYEAVTLLVTNNSLYVVNSELDIVVRAVKLAELQAAINNIDPTVIAFKIQPIKEQAQLLSQSRLVEYVRESQRVMIGELSPSPSPATPLLEEDPHLQFYISPQVRNHFMAVVAFATRHATNRGFPIIR